MRGLLTHYNQISPLTKLHNNTYAPFNSSISLLCLSNLSNNSCLSLSRFWIVFKISLISIGVSFLEASDGAVMDSSVCIAFDL